MSAQTREIPLAAADGHEWKLIAVLPAQPRAALLWLPALGVAAKHYLPFAETLAERGIAVYLHEWRGLGSSNLRPDRENDWAYREILEADLPQSHAAMAQAHAGIAHCIGGHSLGGQLATCFAALQAGAFAQLWLVASGTPYWRAFPAPLRWGLPLLYRFLPWLAQRRGRLNGRRLRFGGMESRGLIRDWARVGLSGVYRATGMEDTLLESALSQLAIPIHGVALEKDWMAPRDSLVALTGKLAPAQSKIIVLNSRQLGARADHFTWMKQPGSVVDCLLE
ncbi:MAG: alpha/beta fold hydrolase [Pseudoxanthomonas sp.]